MVSQYFSCEALSAGIDAVMSAMSGEARFANENEVPSPQSTALSLRKVNRNLNLLGKCSGC